MGDSTQTGEVIYLEIRQGISNGHVWFQDASLRHLNLAVTRQFHVSMRVDVKLKDLVSRLAIYFVDTSQQRGLVMFSNPLNQLALQPLPDPLSIRSAEAHLFKNANLSNPLPEAQLFYLANACPHLVQLIYSDFGLGAVGLRIPFRIYSATTLCGPLAWTVLNQINAAPAPPASGIDIDRAQWFHYFEGFAQPLIKTATSSDVSTSFHQGDLTKSSPLPTLLWPLHLLRQLSIDLLQDHYQVSLTQLSNSSLVLLEFTGLRQDPTRFTKRAAETNEERTLVKSVKVNPPTLAVPSATPAFTVLPYSALFSSARTFGVSSSPAPVAMYPSEGVDSNPSAPLAWNRSVFPPPSPAPSAQNGMKLTMPVLSAPDSPNPALPSAPLARSASAFSTNSGAFAPIKSVSGVAPNMQPIVTSAVPRSHASVPKESASPVPFHRRVPDVEPTASPAPLAPPARSVAAVAAPKPVKAPKAPKVPKVPLAPIDVKAVKRQDRAASPANSACSTPNTTTVLEQSFPVLHTSQLTRRSPSPSDTFDEHTLSSIAANSESCSELIRKVLAASTPQTQIQELKTMVHLCKSNTELCDILLHTKNFASLWDIFRRADAHSDVAIQFMRMMVLVTSEGRAFAIPHTVLTTLLQQFAGASEDFLVYLLPVLAQLLVVKENAAAFVKNHAAVFMQLLPLFKAKSAAQVKEGGLDVMLSITSHASLVPIFAQAKQLLTAIAHVIHEDYSAQGKIVAKAILLMAQLANDFSVLQQVGSSVYTSFYKIAVTDTLMSCTTDPQVALAALKTLYTLVSKDSKRQKDLVRNGDAFLHFIKRALCARDAPELNTYAAQFLSLMGSRDAWERTDMSFVNPLLLLLNSDHENGKIPALRCLVSIATEVRTRVKSVLKQGLSKYLLDVLRYPGAVTPALLCETLIASASCFELEIVTTTIEKLECIKLIFLFLSELHLCQYPSEVCECTLECLKRLLIGVADREESGALNACGTAGFDFICAASPKSRHCSGLFLNMSLQPHFYTLFFDRLDSLLQVLNERFAAGEVAQSFEIIEALLNCFHIAFRDADYVWRVDDPAFSFNVSQIVRRIGRIFHEVFGSSHSSAIGSVLDKLCLRTMRFFYVLLLLNLVNIRPAIEAALKDETDLLKTVLARPVIDLYLIDDILRLMTDGAVQVTVDFHPVIVSCLFKLENMPGISSQNAVQDLQYFVKSLSVLDTVVKFVDINEDVTLCECAQRSIAVLTETLDQSLHKPALYSLIASCLSPRTKLSDTPPQTVKALVQFLQSNTCIGFVHHFSHSQIPAVLNQAKSSQTDQVEAALAFLLLLDDSFRRELIQADALAVVEQVMRSGPSSLQQLAKATHTQLNEMVPVN